MKLATLSSFNQSPDFPNRPLIIAGPCSIETEEQCLETIEAIHNCCPEVNIIRAGIWKPRTRPDSFDGIGVEGLGWLKAAGDQVGLPVMVEVATAEHVEWALKAGIDSLWIGARTTVSPFHVQKLADALSGVSVPVWIKNPVNPDLELWLGAFERLYKAGVTRLGAIHRGFSTYEKTAYRNPPMWEIPIEMRRRHPEIPILVDPSHMGGSRALIAPLSQQALDMGFDGLMIETHYRPEGAWSDAKQQISPQALGEIISNLTVRKSIHYSPDANPLEELRGKIDRIDDYLIELLAERMGLSDEIGSLKKELNLTIHQQDRWADIVSKALEKGQSGGLTREFIIKLFQQIHNESIRHQEKWYHQVAEKQAGS